MSGKKSQRFSAAPADVSTHGANSWVGRFAHPWSRLPGYWETEVQVLTKINADK
jgi:hypothetical protein